VFGYLVVDKPAGLTSHDVVGIVRAVTGVKKVGHTGTLDPFATGVLPLALGKATRFIQYLDENLKVYDATIAFTGATSTGDPEGEVVREGGPPIWERVPEVLASLIGEQMQTPPAYSAVKVDGKPLYKYARAGVEKKAKARPITISGLCELDRGEDFLRVELRCSRGTYARVLADDIALALGSAGHLRALRRTQSGVFVLPGALDLATLAQVVTGTEDWAAAFRNRELRMPWAPREQVCASLKNRVVPLSAALSHLPTVTSSPSLLKGGKAPPPPTGVKAGERYTVLDGGRVLAVAESQGTWGKMLLRA